MAKVLSSNLMDFRVGWGFPPLAQLLLGVAEVGIAAVFSGLIQSIGLLQ